MPLLSPQNIIVIIGIALVSTIIDERSDGALVSYISVSSGESLIYPWSTAIPPHLILTEAGISWPVFFYQLRKFHFQLFVTFLPEFSSLDFVVLTEKQHCNFCPCVLFCF